MNSFLKIAMACLFVLGIYYSVEDTFWISVGAFWGYFNLYFIKKLLQEILIKKDKNIIKILMLLSIKFPLLYVMGYILLVNQVSPWDILIGFSIILFFSLLKLHKGIVKIAKEI